MINDRLVCYLEKHKLAVFSRGQLGFPKQRSRHTADPP